MSTAGAVDAPSGFARFWSAYRSKDRKVDKAKCLAFWKRHGLEKAADVIVAHVERMVRTPKWREGFEPAPLRYLNGRRWEDDVPEQAVLKVVD